MEQLRVLAYLPSGAAGILGGVIMLVAYLGVSGLAGICTLFVMFTTNLK